MVSGVNLNDGLSVTISDPLFNSLNVSRIISFLFGTVFDFQILTRANQCFSIYIGLSFRSLVTIHKPSFCLFLRCKDDELTHLYTLILNSDNTYEVRIDGKKEESGELEADWDFLAPKKIKDPAAKKPDDWIDSAKLDDPEDKKPEDYDKPELIPDPDAKKPEDWDDEEDGDWEPPMINNPAYKVRIYL